MPCAGFLANRLEQAGLALYRQAGRVHPFYDGNSPAALRWWNEHLYEELLAKGWPFGQWDSREDIVVTVDARGELRLVVPVHP